MQKVREVIEADRVTVRGDKGFACYLEGEGKERLFVGPHSADLRITSFFVPAGYSECVVECPADSLTTVDVMPNRFSEVDETSLLLELEQERPLAIKDLIANQIAQIMRMRGDLEADPESVEEANDFDMADDDWVDEPWSANPAAQLVEEYLYPVEEPESSAPEPEVVSEAEETGPSAVANS